ncbi:MAG TPA: glycosyltransferase family 4 protein [Solirubrobacteraceae bacterium]|jgi:glycosyltransferase involved in cell wall biosynthesis
MRIAIIEPFPYGGLLHYSTQLADALADCGNEVDLVVAKEHELAGRPGPAHRRALLAPDATPLPDHPSGMQIKIRRARTAARLCSTWLRIARYVRFSDHDAILLGGSFEMAFTSLGGLLVTHLRGRTPIAHVCHNVRPLNRFDAEELHVRSGPTISLLGRLYPSFDLVFVHGERSRLEFEATWPVTKLMVIPHGDERLFADDPPPPAAEPRILFFGAWSKMKGLGVLMEAFDELAARKPEVLLTIAGPPAPEEGESERVLSWASERRARVEVLPGYVPIEEVKDLFARARVVVLPYLTAYQSGVVHLAMTMARATVVTDVGDLPEAVTDGVSGLIVPARDPHALADALERVLDDAALAERLGGAGHARTLEGSGWPAVAERVQAGLLELVNTTGRR